MRYCGAIVDGRGVEGNDGNRDWQYHGRGWGKRMMGDSAVPHTLRPKQSHRRHRGARKWQPTVLIARLSLWGVCTICGVCLRAFSSAGAKNREGVSTPAPPPPTQAGFYGPRPATTGSSRFRAGGWSPCARAARCPLTSGVCGARAGAGRRGAAAAGAAAVSGGCGCSRYVRVVLRLLGLRLERAGGRHRPGHRRPGRCRALRHALAFRSLRRRPLPPRRRALLFTLRGPHGDRNAQALPPPLPPRVTQSMLGLVVPVMAERPHFLLLGFRLLKLQLPASLCTQCPGLCNAVGGY